MKEGRDIKICKERDGGQGFSVQLEVSRSYMFQQIPYTSILSFPAVFVLGGKFNFIYVD